MSEALARPGLGARTKSPVGIRPAWEVVGELSGSQSRVQRIRAGSATYVLKTGMPGDMAQAEVRGLELLREPATVRVPAVLGWSATIPFVLLEDVVDRAAGESGPTPAAGSMGREVAMATLGRQLAEMHRRLGPRFGLDHDNYLGRTPQKNDWRDAWPDFFRDCRLVPQLRRADRQGLMPRPRRRALEELLPRLDDRLGHGPDASLIHGDLWGGNVVAAEDGSLAVVDPAVSYSDREAEIVMTRLFGGFSPSFHAAYEETWPLPPGCEDRAPIYTLYHLLNHLNLFGESYGAAVDRLLGEIV